MADFQVIMFDLDGTLTDSKPGIINSVLYSLRKFGIEITDSESLQPFIGPPLLDSFQEYCGFDFAQAEQAVKHYREYFAEHGIFQNAVYQGIPELLKDLTSLGKQLFVATSKPRVFAERIMDHFQLTDYFTKIIGSNFDGTLGSKTAVINYALTMVPQIEREQIIMIGDRKYDIIGARNNKIASIGVTYGYGSRDELESEQATYLAESVEALRPILT